MRQARHRLGRRWPVALFAVLAALAAGCRAPGEPSAAAAVRDPQAKKAEVVLPVEDLRVRASVTSWQAAKYANTVRQRYDYSCGSAALATLLQYYFQDPVSEQLVLKTIFVRIAKSKDPKAELEDRVKNGLSMLDLLYAAKDLGYLGAVVRIEFDKLSKTPAPVIVRIEKFGYKHFVVFRGVVADRVFLADPIRGNVRLPAAEFLRQWSGEALFLGKSGFGLPTEHPLAVRVRGDPCPERDIAHQAMLPFP